MKAVGNGLSLTFSGPTPTISLCRLYSKLLAERSSTARRGPPELCCKEPKTCNILITNWVLYRCRIHKHQSPVSAATFSVQKQARRDVPIAVHSSSDSLSCDGSC